MTAHVPSLYLSRWKITISFLLRPPSWLLSFLSRLSESFSKGRKLWIGVLKVENGPI